MLAGELKDPRLAASADVTEVRLSPDLKQVRIFVSVHGTLAEQEAARRGLEAAVGWVRHELIERLRLRRGPEVTFLLDHSEEYGRRIEQLLDQVKKNPV